MHHNRDEILDAGKQQSSVLCVDDEPIALEFLAHTLKEQGFTVFAARDGQEGLYAFSRYKPDIVVTDIEMPRMDGLDMAEAIRRIVPSALIVVATAFDNIEYLKRAIGLQIDEFISKPVIPQELFHALNRSQEKIANRLEEQRAHKFTQLMVSGMPFPVLMVNVEAFAVETVNAAAAKEGYHAGSSLEGCFFPDQVLLALQEMVRISGNKEPERQRLEIETPKRYWAMYINPVSHSRAVVLAIDITWRKQLEQLREDVDRITRHDMKTPLNSVIAFPDLLLDSENLNQEEREYVHLIKDSGYTLLNMINLSLDLYKMEQGTYTLHPQPVDLARVIRRIFLQLKNEARVKQLPTALYGHGHLLGKGDQFWVRGDPLLCYSLFSNLIKNALEASPEGEEVSVRMEIQDTRALIKVHNSGAVPREVREVFFDKLSTYGKNTGTGLGTYSAALMAKTMQGDIDMQTSEEKGTFVLVWLPVESAPQEDTPMGVELL